MTEQNTVQQFEADLQKLVSFKKQMLKLLDLYDELTVMHTRTKQMTLAICLCFGVPMFIACMMQNKLLFGFFLLLISYECSLFAIGIAYVSYVDLDVLKQLKNIINVHFATACRMQFEKFLESIPGWIRFSIPQYVVWRLILSKEIQKMMSEVENTLIKSIHKNFQDLPNASETLESFMRIPKYSEDDKQFVKTILNFEKYKLSLQQLFQFTPM